MDDSVLPRLKDKIESWYPNRSIFLPHLWIHPWLIFFVNNMQEKLKIIFGSLKRKFRTVFSRWSTNDDFAAKLLKPWKTILSENDFGDILFRDIFPKLIFRLESFDPHPLELNVEPLKEFCLWLDTMPYEFVEGILEEYVFAKIELLAKEWAGAGESLEQAEIVEWLFGWKQFFFGVEDQRVEAFVDGKLAGVLAYFGE